MKNLSVKWKMGSICLITVIGLMLICFFTLNQITQIQDQSEEILRNSIEGEYDENIRNQVENAISMLDAVYAEYEKGTYTLAEAEELGANLLRQLRYGEGGYFWADTYEGDNVVLLGSSTEGTNRLHTQDAQGYEMVKNIIEVGKQPEGGYTDYVFPKEGETEPSPKRSYSKAFEPFSWVVGTGNYIDYIETTVDVETQELEDSISAVKNGLAAMMVVLALVIIGYCVYMAATMVLLFQSALQYIQVIAGGDFSQPLPKKLSNRKDDFGKLGSHLSEMKQQINKLLLEVKTQSNALGEIVSNVKGQMATLGESIEDISATTEELAASMEETAASTETVNNVSNQIEEAAKNIAVRSQEGASQAEEVHTRAAKAQTETRERRQSTAKIHQEIRESLTQALEGVKVVEQIDVLSATIMSITSQTNLLALNASIEAARAGEAGRGFAVVATEIGGLAEQSKETVSKIQTVTENVTSAVNHLAEDAQKLLDFLGEDVVEGYNMFDQVAAEYNQDAEKISAMVEDFSATSQELTASIDGILDSMSGITTATNEGAQGTTNIAQKATDIAQYADMVTREVERCNETADLLNHEISAFQIEE